ncbi:MAG: ketoacyl-ACP synthase III [Chitinophagales bacterium]|nr:ketoacyl-ACP synthase III [Chitinophagales bacterium]MDW8428035.1 beta-ketoacyl-ACP synthase III [Chitinophagales bacterium]
MAKITAAITGVHGWVPEAILSNADLEKMVDTTDEWIVTRTGIRERRLLKGEGKGTSVIGVNAVRGLLKKTNTNPDSIELLICATTTPDMQFPATANIICDEVGLKHAWGYDLNAACSGFLYALATAARMIESGAHRRIIVVGADKMSSIIDYTDRTTCVLFGDGGGAVLLEPNTHGLGILDSIMYADGSGRVHLHQKAGGSVLPASHETVEKRLHYVYQEGQAVYKFAVSRMADVGYEIMTKNGLTPDDIAYLVPHQANKRIIDATRLKMGLPEHKVMINIERYGNTTNGTIPLCLWEWERKLHVGDNLILCAFGGGFTWGAIYMKWAYNSR